MCGCEFLIKIIVSLSCGKTEDGETIPEATILVHNVHIGHDTRSNTDNYFLLVYPMVVKRAMEDLKRLVSTSVVALASLKDEDTLQEKTVPFQQSFSRIMLILSLD